ncbi:MAG: hypothetical protein DME80_13595 [Verrucomicrobia bacterium]|nr:MAG: hypothetical protein DME89_05090 [Verrucomicrobiota bacterium]PYJ41555.1 MAG: hypothetical protein DME80_13595 [Verrucomicrobiota bacterium]PYL50976.1 MAG: hypothetical protein DMF33_11600 [Verrucomicrobiota bacterium]
MSERLHGVPTPEGEYFDSGRFAGLSFVLGVVAVIALVLCAVGAIVNPHQFGYSWLFAFAFFFTLCAGCFFWTIVHHATDAEWSVVVRRQLENLGALLTVLALLFVPILLLRHHLFVWMDIPPGVDPSLDTKRAYLNWPFFLVRAVIFLGFFLLAALALRRLSAEQDKDGNPRFTISMRKVSFISLPMFALCLTFGAYDWLVGLNYRWFSTMFGVYIFAGAAGSSMSLLVLVITALRQAGYLKDVVTVEHYHIMGKWMLAFCIFWAYIGFGQYMLIWYANIPEETQYFINRNTQSWWALSMLLVIGRFFVPFAILLLRSVKTHPRQLCIVAAWLVCMQMLDIYLIVLPSLHGTGFHPSIWDLLSVVAIGATLGFVYLRMVPRTSLFPVRDPRLIESLTTVN